MPYLVYSETVTLETTPNNVTVALPAGVIQTNDFIIIGVAQDNATGFTTPSGYTAQITFGANAGVGMQVFTKVAGSSESDPNIVGVADDWVYDLQIWRDVDTTTPVETTSKTNWTTTATATSADVTTSTDNCVVLDYVCGDSTLLGFHDQTATPVGYGNANGTCLLSSCYKTKQTAGTSTGVKWYWDQADEGGNLVRLVLKNKASGKIPPVATPVTMIEPSHLAAAATISAPNAFFTTIGGVNVDTSVTTADAVQTTDPFIGVSYVRVGSSNNNNYWAGGVFTLASTANLSGAIVSFLWRMSTLSVLGTLGTIVVFRDGSGNWAAYRLSPKLGISASPTVYTSHVEVGVATAYDSSGTIDWTNITHIAPLHQRNSNTTAGYIEVARFQYSKAANNAFLGGSTAAPINLGTIGINTLGTRRSNHGYVDYSGVAQLIGKHNVTIGDASTPCYVDFDKGSLESPATYSLTGQRLWNVSTTTWTMVPCATCTFLIRNCILAPRVRSTWRWSSSGSASATVSHAGATFSNFDWYDDIGYVVTGAKFSGCYTVQGTTGTEWQTCAFEAGAGTELLIMGATGQKAQNCTFAAGSAGQYGIKITTAGDYYLQGSTFSTSTTDINVTVTTGTVTIHLSLGQTQPTYTTAGATVVFDQEVLDTSFTNADLADGTTILVYNVTQATTIEYVASLSTGTGYTISMVPGTDYVVGDVIEIRMSQKDGDVYYVEKTYRIVTSAGGGDFVDEGILEECAVCNSFNLDGSSYSSLFDIDEANDELDILISGPWAAGELITWWKWQMTQQSAMEDYWLAWDVQSDGSFMNDTTKISSYLDNTTASSAIESSGRRIWRSDGARPIRDPTSGGGALDVAWREPVTIVETGTSGLTPTEAATLDVLNSFTFTVPGQVDANIQYVNDTQVIGIGTTDNPWNPIGGD